MKPPEAPIAIVAEKASWRSRIVIVVDRQSACISTATPVSFASSANGTLPLLLVEKGLVRYSGKSPPACLTVPIAHAKAVPAAECAVVKPWKLLYDLLLPTVLANHQAVANALGFAGVEACPDQVSAHDAKRHTHPSGDLADG